MKLFVIEAISNSTIATTSQYLCPQLGTTTTLCMNGQKDIFIGNFLETAKRIEEEYSFDVNMYKANSWQYTSHPVSTLEDNAIKLKG